MKNSLNLVLGETETVESVFEKFNGTITAVESENDCQLVKDYDNFINAVDFDLRIYAIRKLENENFWRVLRGKNDYKVVNMAKTYGKSTIYQIAKDNKVIGFYLNNMLHDGQSTYFLWSYKETTLKTKVISNKSIVNNLFINTKMYPKRFQYRNEYKKVLDKNTQSFVKTKEIKKAPSRWTRIIDYLESIGASSIDAWKFLEDDDARIFYGELKKHNVFSRQDKELLKAIHNMHRITSFDVKIEVMESRIQQLNDLINEYEENKDTETTVLDYFYALEELEELEKDLISFSEEHNNESSVTTLEDYKW